VTETPMTTTPSAAPAQARFAAWLRSELRPRQFITSLNAALVIFLVEIIIVLSLTALIFSGRLAVYLPRVIPAVIVGDALLVTLVAIFSTYGGSIAVVQDAPSAVLAAAVAGLAATLPVASGPEQLFATVLVLLVGSTLAMGVVYLLLGYFKLGGLVRFLPYPVLGGFLAGTGWLLTVGGIGVTTDVPLGAGLLQPGVLAHWLPAMLLGLLMLLAARRWQNPLILAAAAVLAVLAFYAMTSALGQGFTTLTAGGWLLGPVPQGLAWQFPLNSLTLAQVNWPALLGAIPAAAPALVVSLVALLLNASGLELMVKQDIQLNRELLAAGAGNLLAGLAGGLIGYHAISSSAVSHALGRGKRLPGLLTALLLSLTVAGAGAALAYVPRLVLGGVLAYIGLALLYEWVVQAWSTFPKIDYAVILAILATIALRDFLWGIGLGLILTVVLFVVNYSRVSVVQYELGGSTYQSRVNRSLSQAQWLRQHGDQLLIFKLRGFIFFGTANQLFERIRLRVRRAASPVRYVLLDFAQVSGLDSSGRLSFDKLIQFAHESNIELVLTGLTDRLRSQLQVGGARGPGEGPRLLADLDRGIEWCEDRIIAGLETPAAATASLADQLATLWPDRAQIDELLRRLERREVAAGEYLMRQGDEPDQLFLLETGQVTAQIEKPGSVLVRLETMQGGRVVGELGFFLGTRRNASVVADRPTVVYCLTRSAWDEIQTNHPDVAQTLTGLVIHLLGQRVQHLSRAVEALQRQETSALAPGPLRATD